MRCSGCGAENPATAKFCAECGARLPRACPSCGHEVGPTAKFCGECGSPLGNVPPSEGAAPQPPSPASYMPPHLAAKILTARVALEGERKHVTVLFADLQGSTELIQDLDPEQAQALLDGAVRAMMDAVHRFEGTVNHILGDGIMALFGAPIAHEDHAVRACYAALAMQGALGRYAEQVRREHGSVLQFRIGLNSGEVVVRAIRNDLQMDYSAMGQTVHLAARMEQVAMPGTVVLTPATVALTEGYIRVASLGPIRVKGLAEPLEVFELVGAAAIRTRLQASAARGLTRFVGRQTELETLHTALERAQAGRGQVVALVGEPGVGKSRLLWELTHSYRTQGWTILEGSSVSYGRATSYLPVIDLLKAYCRIEPRDDARTAREKLLGKLLTQEGVPFFINARTDVFWPVVPGTDAEKLDEAVRRAQAYLDAGADCFYPILLGDLATLTRLREAIQAPINVLAPTSQATLRELEEAGIARLSLGPALMWASLTVMRTIAQELQNYGSFDRFTRDMIPTGEILAYVSKEPMG